MPIRSHKWHDLRECASGHAHIVAQIIHAYHTFRGDTIMLNDEKRQALVGLVGEAVAERLISTMATREKEATDAGVTFKELTPPTAEQILAVLTEFGMKGADMPTTDETLKHSKAEGEEDMAKAEDTMADTEEDMAEEEEDMSEEESLLSDAEIKAIAKAVVDAMTKSMKEMTEELKGYMGKREKDDSAVAYAEAQTAALEELAKSVKEVGARLKALEDVSGTPYRPSQTASNVIGTPATTTKSAAPAHLDPAAAAVYNAFFGNQ